MKILDKEFKKNGMFYTLIERTPTKALYGMAFTIEDLSNFISYEAHTIRIQEKHTSEFGGKQIEYPKKEVLASNEQFGTYGWSYQHYENAKKKYDELE